MNKEKERFIQPSLELIDVQEDVVTTSSSLPGFEEGEGEI